MVTRRFPAVQVEGDAVDIAAQMAIRVVMPVAQQVLDDAGANAVLKFYAGLIVALQLQAAVVMGKETACCINEAAAKELAELDVDALQAIARQGGPH